MQDEFAFSLNGMKSKLSILRCVLALLRRLGGT